MGKLINMVDFVLDQYEEIQQSNVFEKNCFNYAKFLKQPLELWMFVPCKLVDGVWVVLEEPYIYKITAKTGTSKEEIEWVKAKERCLFKGFEIEKKADWHIVKLNDNPVWVSWNKSKTIEDLVTYEPLLTATAQKQIGL